MQYVPFGQLGFNVSRLGFGMMRLPMNEINGEKIVDEERTKAMLRHAIDSGVNYVDTAYPYCGRQSEPVVGRCLKDGYREKVKLATKLPCWLVETEADLDRLLDEQLRRLDVPQIDFYLLHALGKDRWEKMKSLHVTDFLDRAVKDGRIVHPSFSFHDDYPVFREIMTSYDWHMAQIQFNYLDIYDQAGLAGVRLARQRNVPLVVMEPLRGGALANPGPDIQAIMNHTKVKRSAPDWAFRYIADFKEVAVILSGMSTEEQVEDNLRIFNDVTVGGMTDAEKRLIGRLRAGYLARMPIGCTGCRYCMPCPKGVNIPALFKDFNESRMLSVPDRFKRQYAGYVKDENDAGRCVGCGACEKQCPQHLPIRDWLKKLDAEGKAE